MAPGLHSARGGGAGDVTGLGWHVDAGEVLAVLTVGVLVYAGVVWGRRR